MNQAKKHHFDYIVVGAGAGGSVIASRLSEDAGARILVLEAGPSDASVYIRMPAAQAYPLIDNRRTWRFDTGPERFLDDRTIMHLRGKMMGGSSSLNGMVYVRGNPRDYDTWAGEGLPDWSFAHCLPYFKRLESYDQGANAFRGGDGPVRISTMPAETPLFRAFLDAGQQAGQPWNDDYNGYRQEGIHRHQANIDHGIRASAGRAYLRPALKRGNVELILEAAVSRVLFNDQKRAVGVEYLKHGETFRVEAEREVILCGGAYKSPHLLLLSGIGPVNQLKEHGLSMVSHVPGVGRGLQDHVCAPVAYRSSKSGVSPGVNMNLLKMGWIGAQWLFGRSGLGASNLWETGSFFRSHDGADYCDMQHEFVPLLGEYGQGKLVVDEGFYYSTCLMRPRSRGFVELTSADPQAHPKIVNNYLQDEYDQRCMIAAVKFTDEIIQQPAWDSLRGAGVSPPLRTMSDADVLAWLRKNSSTQYHPSATCRMGSDDMSVVDSHGLVHGVSGLRVADASVIPRVTSGNLQCPTLMVAEKISDHIKGRSLAPEYVDYADKPRTSTNGAVREQTREACERGL
ncbi:choline dehydrogenase [Paraburkholderia sp.]|uniref:choline dehydrogenase n=1 Tax=Paraburkholderia sp. TaxID=1926495 RepID=UPI003C7D32C7